MEEDWSKLRIIKLPKQTMKRENTALEIYLDQLERAKTPSNSKKIEITEKFPLDLDSIPEVQSALPVGVFDNEDTPPLNPTKPSWRKTESFIFEKPEPALILPI